MANATIPPAPGSMTVPVTAGWEDIATVLLLLATGAVAFLVLGAVGAALTGRSEWQAWLDGRSRSRRDPASDPPS